MQIIEPNFSMIFENNGTYENIALLYIRFFEK